MKHLDTISLLNVVPSASTVTVLNQPAQGTTSTTRIGNLIRVRAIDLQNIGQYSSGTTTTYQKQFFQFRLVRYKKTSFASGATPFSIAELLYQDGNSQYSPMSLMDPDTADANFQILCDQILEVDLNFGSGANILGYSKMMLHRVECDFEVEFNSSSSASLVNNALFFVITALNPINSSGSSAMWSNMRMWYSDS
jgi:hypothetical protein